MFQEEKMATLSDIAARAECSVNLVSYVLHKKKPPTKEKHREILRIANELGYVSNRVASALVTGRTNNLTLIIGSDYRSTISNVFFSVFMYELTSQLTKEGIGLTLYASDGEQDELENIVLNGMTDGVMWYMKRPSEHLNERMAAIGLPSLSIYVPDAQAASLEKEGADFITIDDYSSEYGMVRYLYEKGHRRIVFVGSEDSPRFRAYSDFCKEHSLGILPNIHAGRNSFINRRLLEEYIAKNGLDFTAMVCVTDEVAISMLWLLDGMGYKVPDDISVVGYDDIPDAKHSSPPLTTIHHNCEEVAKYAKDYFVRKRSGEGDSQPIRLIFTQSIVERSSVSSIEE